MELIEILGFEMETSPNNFMDVFIKYDGIYITYSNFHFNPRSDLNEEKNWYLTDSRAVHSVEDAKFVTGLVCLCGEPMKRKYKKTINDFCQEFSKSEYRKIVLKKMLENKKMVKNITKQSSNGIRKRYVSVYGDLNELSEADASGIKQSLLNDVKLEFIKKSGEYSYDLNLNLTDGNSPIVLEGIKIQKDNKDKPVFVDTQKVELRHRNTKNNLSFCMLCLENLEENGEKTLCKVLNNQEHIGVLSSALMFSTKGEKLYEDLGNLEIGEELMLVKTNTKILPPIKINGIEELIKFGEIIKSVTLNRNDPCYCGSGKKYKKCCLNK
jgi:hypothetical protein